MLNGHPAYLSPHSRGVILPVTGIDAGTTGEGKGQAGRDPPRRSVRMTPEQRGTGKGGVRSQRTIASVEDTTSIREASPCARRRAVRRTSSRSSFTPRRTMVTGAVRGVTRGRRGRFAVTWYRVLSSCAGTSRVRRGSIPLVPTCGQSCRQRLAVHADRGRRDDAARRRSGHAGRREHTLATALTPLSCTPVSCWPRGVSCQRCGCGHLPKPTPAAHAAAGPVGSAVRTRLASAIRMRL
jgi:hypothetical protein